MNDRPKLVTKARIEKLRWKVVMLLDSLEFVPDEVELEMGELLRDIRANLRRIEQELRQAGGAQ